MRSQLLVVLILLCLMAGCGGGNNNSTSNPSNSPNVTITPATASVAVNTTAQFSAAVTNSTAGVFWAVNDVVNGNLTVGTISGSGLYTAPAVVPNPATVTIKAISLADQTQFSSATVTITSGTALTISVTPSTASVFTGRSQQFTATFNSQNNTGVTWQVNSVTFGDATHGTINGSGLYTAPATVPSPATVTITAISQSDTSKSASATVTIVAGTTIVVTPSFKTLPAGGTQTFTATANAQPASVTWSLTCNSTQAGACGSITSGGVYTAPPFPPPGGVVAITATSTDQSALPAGANVAVQIGNGSLSGKYAFSLTGKSNGTPYASAGSIIFDGAGNITGGSEDVNTGTTASTTITGGTYQIGVDGRGSATVQTGSGNQTWQIVLKDNTRAVLMRGETGVTGVGALYLQNPIQFAGSLQGNYSLQLSGPVAGQTGSAAIAAAFNAGAGVISAGKLDASEGISVSTALAATGAYTAPDPATGRGTLTLISTYGTQNCAYYMVDATRAVLVQTDSGKVLRGELVQQPAGPFNLASFAGSYAALVSGTNTQGPLGIGMVLVNDGSGTVTSGVADSNANGTIQLQSAVTGTYAVTDSTIGRTEFTLTVGGQSRKFVLYPESGNAATALEIDGVQTALGRAYLQATNASSASLFQGSYATGLVGTDFTNSSGEQDVVGLFTPNGGSAITGTVDINDNGTVALNATVQASYLGSTTPTRTSGLLTTSSGTLSSGTFIYYTVDGKRTLVLEADSNRVLSGVMEKP